MAGTTSYTGHWPDWLWAEFKKTVPANDNINDGLIDSAARDVLEFREDELTDEQKEQIQEVLLDERG